MRPAILSAALLKYEGVVELFKRFGLVLDVLGLLNCPCRFGKMILSVLHWRQLIHAWVLLNR